MNYEIELFVELNERLKKIWNNLEQDSDHTCFNSLAWIENYNNTYYKTIKFRIFVIFFKNKPICIVPFEIIKKFNINILQWACDTKSDFNAPPQDKNFSFKKDSFEYIWNQILLLMPNVDLINLKRQINFSSNINNPFINYLTNSREGIIQQINLPTAWETYKTATLKKKFYLDLMRTKRLIKKYGKVQFVIAKNSEEKISFINELAKQKEKNLIKINAKPLSIEDLNFYKNFEKMNNKKYITQVSGIKLNGEFIAMHWGIFSKNYYYYLLPSMKEDNVKKFSPGKLLLSLLIRWAISKKINYFDFGLGQEAYKKSWTNKSQNIYRYIKLKRIKAMPFYLIIKTLQIIKNFKN